MICNICFGMLRGQVGRQLRGSYDLSFDHQPNLRSLRDSARSQCFICRRIVGDMPLSYNRSKAGLTSFGQNKSLIAAHIKAWEAGAYYRLEFTLQGDVHYNHPVSILLLEPTGSCSKRVVYTPQSNRLDSAEVLQLARYWIGECMSDVHQNCPDADFGNRINPKSESSLSPRLRTATGLKTPVLQRELSSSNSSITSDSPWYPTRLLDLGTVDDPFIKLIVTKRSQDRDSTSTIIPEPLTGQYVTLSHCWGNSANFCLNANNLDDFQKTGGIPLKELSRTFQDAIWFARRLSQNVKYIWIDSLCIIQKNEPDWLLESIQMYQVYRNSYCNISATAAENGDQGLFATRDPQHLWDETVDLNTNEVLSPSSDVRRHKNSLVAHEALIERCKIVDPSHWERTVEAAPVNMRAWVLQERLLAPRVIHFCEDQIAWECREIDASESSTDGIDNVKLRFGEIIERGTTRLKSLVAPEYGELSSYVTDPQLSSKQAQENWNLITERYSTTKLTNAKDKLIALAGIAQQMSGQIDGRYVAGMWHTAYFASQLLWRVDPLYHNPKFLHPSRRPDVHRAPSFSWAAIDAPQGIRCGEIKEEDELLIKVTDVQVSPESRLNSDFGLVKEGGYIEIECQMLPVTLSLKSRRTIEGTKEDVYTWTHIDGKKKDARMHPNVYLDSPEDDFDRIRLHSNSSVWLVPAYKNNLDDLVGLLLHRTGDTLNQFHRVGLTVIPRYVSSNEEIMSKTSIDEKGNFKSVGKEVIRIF